jgi:peptidoglycan/LPS O-acetylase OafA/YrhL
MSLRFSAAVTSTNTPRLSFRPDIEGLRAVAILLVVAVHAGVPWLPGGFVGVDVFFVLSGYLITGLLVKEASDTGQMQLLQFYVRRLRRLLPALLAMMLLVSALAAFVIAPTQQVEQSTSASMAVLWLSNFYFSFANLDYFSPGSETNLFLHTWSLGVEEQFYLIWPALLLGLLGGNGARNFDRLKIGMLLVLSISLLACIVSTYQAPLLAFYMMPMRAWQFAAGALVWLYFTGVRNAVTARLCRHAGLLKMLGWSGLLSIVCAGLALNSTISYPGAWALLPTLGTAAVLAAGSSDEKPSGAARVLAWQPLQWIGRISYSWYLWHWPILLLGPAVTGSNEPGFRLALILVSLVLACISHVLVEVPLRTYREWLMRPRMAILLSFSLMLTAMSICVRWNSYASELVQSPSMLRYVMAHHDAPLIYGMGCDEWYSSSRVRICEFGSDQAPHTAILMGDSHAGQWFPAVASVFHHQDWRLLVVTKSSCPMVDEPFFYKRIGREYTECSEWRKDALKQVAAIKPDALFLGSSQYEFSKIQWINGTERLLTQVNRAVGHVYIFRDTPSLPFDGPDCLLSHARRPIWMNRLSSCTAPAENPSAALTYSWQRQAAAGFANVSMLDMNQSVCPGGTCSAEVNGEIVFRDSQHLAGGYAASLGPALASKLDGSLTAVNR